MPSTKSENPTSPASPNALKAFFLAARPRTWSASLSPVLIGTALAAREVSIETSIFILTLLFSFSIQIGTNYANDYFDFVNNADTSARIGPKRAVQQGWISPKAMLFAALAAFACAFLFALPLMISVGLWSFPVAALCILLGLLYTGGPKPLGYLGLGELLVLFFFGPVAVLGTYFLQTGGVSASTLLASLPPGLISAAILIANNLRDETTDRLASKRTIVVRFGRRFGSWAYALSLAAAALAAFLFSKILIAIFLLAIPFIKKAFRFGNPAELIAVLQGTSLLLLLYTLFFCWVVLT